MSDPRPLYPKGLRLEMDPRDVWAVTRRPPNVSEALTSTFSDLYWKTYAIVHHAGRVVELEQKECGAVVESLKQQPRLVGIAQTCSSTMRFEYEAMLGAAYAAQSLLARAVIESLTGATLEDEKRLPSFSELDDAIDNKSVQPGMIAAGTECGRPSIRSRRGNRPTSSRDSHRDTASSIESICAARPSWFAGFLACA
jgi:hypothetical protein